MQLARALKSKAVSVLLVGLGMGGLAAGRVIAEDMGQTGAQAPYSTNWFGSLSWSRATSKPAGTAKLGDAPREAGNPSAEGLTTADGSDQFQDALRSPASPSGIELTQYGTVTPSDPAPGTGPGGGGGGDGGYSGGLRMNMGMAGMGMPAPPPASSGAPAEMPAPKFTVPLLAKWGTAQGFQLQSEDGEFTFQFHNLTQLDYRQYRHTTNIPNGTTAPLVGGPTDTFTFPRVWWIFSGTLTKNWEYMVAPSFQFDNVNLLDAWVNAHYDDRVQFKLGRYKTPFTYEFYAEPIQGLVNPERSLFFNNFGLNRQDGVMMHGTVLDKYADYAIGVFNGQRNAFLSNTNSKDVAGFFNLRPFMNSDWEFLQRVDVGASFDYGDENNPPSSNATPTVLRTNIATNGNLVNGVEFLQLRTTVFERGQRALGAAHLAYYYGPLSMIAEIQGGTENYTNVAPAAIQRNSRVPISSWYFQSGYFLTGECVTFRNTVAPLCPFTLKPGGGWGAWELAFRYNNLRISERIFTDGLADPNHQWTNQVNLVDLGVNWYPNQWLKCAVLWEHANFANPVSYGEAPNLVSSYNDMFWTRMQVWF